MRSIRKIAMFVLALSASLAVALPAVASAARLEQPVGTLMPVGSLITAKSQNFVFHTSWGNLTCNELVLQSKVIQNDGASVQGVWGGPGAAKSCFINGTQEMLVTPELTSLNLSGPQRGTAGLEITMQLPKATCHLKSSSLAVTYSSGSSVLSISGPMEVTPACGPMTIQGSYSLTDNETGKPVYVF